MSSDDSGEISRREQLRALIRVGKYRPIYTAAIIVAGIFVALLEAVGVTLIIPIVEIAQSSGDTTPTTVANGMLLALVRAHGVLEILSPLGTGMLGVSLVLTVRWMSLILVRWERTAPFTDQTTRAVNSREKINSNILSVFLDAGYIVLFLVDNLNIVPRNLQSYKLYSTRLL